MAPEPLVCPTCSRPHAADQRFCEDCGMPLIPAGSLGRDLPVSERHAFVRKIKPQYSDGELVRVTGAQNQADAELIRGLLIEEGIPSLIRRSRGVDVPDMLSAGRRDILVPSSGVVAAREMLRVDPERPRLAMPEVDRRRKIRAAGLAVILVSVPVMLLVAVLVTVLR